MRAILIVVVALVAFDGWGGASADEIHAMRQPPTAPPRIFIGGNPAPTKAVLIACRVNDLTGQPGRHDPTMAAPGWRDYELRINDAQEYECKREELELNDSAQLAASAPADLLPLDPDFSDLNQCARVGVVQAQAWNEKHAGWAVVGVGCPVPIVNADGRVIAWKMPECPVHLPGSPGNRIKCTFDESLI